MPQGGYQYNDMTYGDRHPTKESHADQVIPLDHIQSTWAARLQFSNVGIDDFFLVADGFNEQDLCSSRYPGARFSIEISIQTSFLEHT